MGNAHPNLGNAHPNFNTGVNRGRKQVGLPPAFLGSASFSTTPAVPSFRSAVKLAKKLIPDIVILDISMPILNGIEAAKQLSREVPRAKVIVMSMHSDNHFVLGALHAGVAGYLLKDAAFEELLAAVRAVLKGQIYLSPAIAGVVVKASARHSSSKREFVRRKTSSREREVLQLLVEGKSTKEIASALYVSVKTIETHRKQIMDKLKLHSIAELTKYAIREGVTTL
jgi:DNA-binding NarL/FixJ family response regulator